MLVVAVEAVVAFVVADVLVLGLGVDGEVEDDFLDRDGGLGLGGLALACRGWLGRGRQKGDVG